MNKYELSSESHGWQAIFIGTYYGMARASVCLTVRLSTKLLNTIQTEPFPARTVKLGTHTTYDKRTTPIDFQGQRVKAPHCFKTL